MYTHAHIAFKVTCSTIASAERDWIRTTILFFFIYTELSNYSSFSDYANNTSIDLKMVYHEIVAFGEF